MRQGVAVRVSEKLFELGAARKVAALMRGVAPGSVEIPVPGGTSQLRILAIGDRAQNCRKRFLQNRRAVDGVDRPVVQNIEGRSECLIWIEGNGPCWRR